MERADLNGETYVEPRADQDWWLNGDPWSPTTTNVLVGELPASGRWYARWHGAARLRPGAALYTGPGAEHYARATARRWMRAVGGEWAEA